VIFCVMSGYWRGVNPRLPQPDPHESFGMEPAKETRLTAPMAVFVKGPPSPESDGFSDAILDLRPGMLIVVAPD
jgi:hypothetical protein